MDPEVGDIAVLWRNDQKGWQGHVGFFVRQDGSRIWLLGGNQSNEVNIQDYQGSQLLGYRRAASCAEREPRPSQGRQRVPPAS